MNRLYRKHTKILENGDRIKDLTILSKSLKKVIIVDNVPENFQNQKENGIYIKSWYNDKDDRGLIELLRILEELINSEVEDVREFLRIRKQKLIENI